MHETERDVADARAASASASRRDRRLRHRLLVAELPAAASRSTSSRSTRASSTTSTRTTRPGPSFAAIVQLAHSLKLRTVAEGVETDAQQKRLVRLGCDRIQGFVIARPMDARSATDFVLGSSLISLWVGHAGPELTIIKSVVADFERRSGIRVEVTGGVTDQRIQESIEADDPPTVVSSFESDSFATPGSRTALVEPRPLHACATASTTRSSRRPRPNTRAATTAAGRCRCSRIPTAWSSTGSSCRRPASASHRARSRR